ncbi:hypothetical protein DESUT3_31320 [Desulfuromonas versatilis]|uniref:Squalene cyclase C-terminal domain-containing protein n=1 Tax=Desulfuromonas versatilis TaxID=2802975 RepID=A0ABM8HVT4_9BACT|nr:carboxypeptidase regulatory-like domain-containing protein [Desulfuromonas versatilis]BCR06063.1 hypothetical protein DESUT3_31320 [Desulfuromonas versatilis]
MLKRISIFVGITLCFAIVTGNAQAQLPPIASGLAYLTSSQGPEGNWGSGTSLVEPTVATGAALEALKLLNQTAGTPYSTGLSWLEAQSFQSIEHIAARIRLLGLSDVNALIPALDSAKGGWGGYLGYETNNLDTILALQALKSANYQTPTVIYPSLAYITGTQNPDGGWGFRRGDGSSVYMTAVISAVLQQFPQMTTIATAVNKATAYLSSRQNSDGGFGGAPSSVHETALSYIALVAVSTDVTALEGAINFLVATQAADGSWSDDPYSTALALKALHLSEQKPPPPPPPAAGGRITGTVVDATTTLGVGGVAVALASNPLINTTTDSSGNFSLEDVPTGDQLVNFSMAGYASHTVTTGVADRAVVNLGKIPLLSSYSAGTIAGTIKDPSGQPLSGVSVAVSGAWTGSAVTGDDGNFMFTFVTPGEVTISASKAGYLTVTGGGTVFARTTLSFSPRMGNTPSQVTTGSIVGRVVENTTGRPLDSLPDEEGVTVRISGGLSVEPDPDNGGYFQLQGLAPNTYQVTVGMNGFASHTFRVVVMPGVTIDLGTIRLSMSFAMTLTGKVTNASTGVPISGAEVAVMGTHLTARTDFAGTYVIADINYPEITIKAAATGYKPKSYIIGTAPWTQTMDIALAPLVTTGGLAGAVIDALSSQPLSGVSLSLAGDPSVSATTNSNGEFLFNTLQKDAQQIKLSLSGYAPLVLTANVTAGAVNNVGKVGMTVNPGPAYIQGTVWDGIVDAPFAGVEMQATGTGFWQTHTSTEGTYKISNVTPGTVSVTAAAGPKPGYYGARFTGPLAPGGVLIFNPTLSTIPPPGILKGTVFDGSNNKPIFGATITLTPAPEGFDPGFTDGAGAFSVSGIPVGTYAASISAPGYSSQSVNVDIIAGYLGETSIEVPLQRYYTSSTISGKITDAATGATIAGANISIPGTNKSTVSDAQGNYLLSGITSMSVSIKASAEGYDSKVFSFRVNAFGEYDVPLALNLEGTSTTTVFGTVRDAETNLPIVGAEVAIVGGNKSAATDADGSYSLGGVTEMVMDLKASAPGYSSRYVPLASDTYGEYEVLFSLTKSRLSNVTINTLATDKFTYGGNELVTIESEIENLGDTSAEISVGAEMVDQYGNVVGLVSFPANPIVVDAQASQPVSLAWNTEKNAPGSYQVVLTLVDHAQGGLLAENRTSFTIVPTAEVEGLVSLISPKFVNIRATETIGLSAYLVNKSNAEVTLSAQYEIKDPDGNTLTQGSQDFLLTASEQFKNIPLPDFSNTFGQSGQYPVTIKIFNGEAPLAQTADAIYVAPSIRIVPSKTLDPTTVIPDGDKDIQIKIQLKGVEEL